MRDQYGEILLKHWSQRFSDVFSEDNYTPMLVESESDAQRLLTSFPYEGKVTPGQSWGTLGPCDHLMWPTEFTSPKLEHGIAFKDMSMLDRKTKEVSFVSYHGFVSLISIMCTSLYFSPSDKVSCLWSVIVSSLPFPTSLGFRHPRER